MPSLRTEDLWSTMSCEPVPPFSLINKSSGLTPSETHLARLCERSFLRFWSYPNPYRDQRPNGELCDLLVVFDNTVIIFSDKSCVFPNTSDLSLDWNRWHRRAVEKSANQLFGAERWIREHPDRIFLDQQCTQPFPVPIATASELKVHRVVVARGSKARCCSYYGSGSGSLILAPLMPLNQVNENPFMIGDVGNGRGFVHVLDDVTLGCILGELDTIADFLRYIQSKESLIERGLLAFAAGEEELLAQYLWHRAGPLEERFGLQPGYSKMGIEEGMWLKLQTDEQFRERKQLDRISYLWDDIINRFARHSFAGEVNKDDDNDKVEWLAREMAREPRFQRRMLATAFHSLAANAGPNQIVRRSVMSEAHRGTAYVFLCLPRKKELHDNAYREIRRTHLEKYCFVFAWKYRDFNRIVGLATESGVTDAGKSYDLVMVDDIDWDDDACALAEQLQKEENILFDHKLKMNELHAQEYPEIVVPKKGARLHSSKIGRNDPCPCGSQAKYKRCCGRSGVRRG